MWSFLASQAGLEPALYGFGDQPISRYLTGSFLPTDPNEIVSRFEVSILTESL